MAKREVAQRSARSALNIIASIDPVRLDRLATNLRHNRGHFFAVLPVRISQCWKFDRL
jgi:hypothetical protein